MEKSKSPTQRLDEAIYSLEASRAKQKKELHTQWKQTVASVRPSNLINQVVRDISSAPEIKGNIMSLITSLIGGYASKKLIVGESKSVFKKLLGYIFQNQITRWISNKINTN